MKKIVTVFERNKYYSDGTGNPQNYFVKESLIAVLGGADDIRVEVTTYGVSSTNARWLVTLTEGTKSEERPGANLYSGKGLTFFPSAAPTPAPTLGADTPVQVSGPFSGLVDAALRIFASSGSAQEWVDMEIRVTLFYNN